MKRLASLSLALLLISGPASAFDATGLYIGLTGTLAPGEVTNDVDQKESLAGGMIGGQIGYRYDAGWIVPGIEADYLWGSTDAETANERMGIDQVGTLRGTLGIPLGPFLPYLSGGVAIAQSSVEDTTVFSQPVQDNVHLGYAAGGGLEFELTSSISVRGEYQYMALGPMDVTLSSGSDALEYDIHAFKIGANLHF